MSGARQNSRYVWVFLALVVLTALEVGVVRLDALVATLHLAPAVTLTRAGRITALVGLAMTKAATVSFIFMDLRSGSRALKLAVGVPLVLAPALAIVLMLDAVYRAVGAR